MIRTVLLIGWKEIAAYLKCEVRSAQRWTREAGLPARKAGNASGAPITAYSEQLDEWLRHRPTRSQTNPAAIFDRALQLQIDFLWTELRIGNEFVKLALISRNVDAVSRRRAGARKAYDAALKMLSANDTLSDAIRRQLLSELRGLKRKLEELGETFAPEPGA